MPGAFARLLGVLAQYNVLMVSIGVVDSIAAELVTARIKRPLAGELIEVLGALGIHPHELHVAFEQRCLPIPDPRCFTEQATKGPCYLYRLIAESSG